MDDLLPKTLRCRINGITLEVCHGEIPQIFQQLWFDPITEFELPKSRAPDKEFIAWLEIYRHAQGNLEQQLLIGALCQN